MSYFDWPHIVKPFTVTPVVEDTLTDRKIDTVFTSVNAIGTKTVSIAVPAVTFTQADYAGSVIPIIIGQYNYSVSYPITIINPSDIVLDPAAGVLNQVAICLRYRVGTTVYRYLLAKTLNGISRSLIPYPFYNNQTILGNFVLEFWQLQALGTFGVAKNFVLQTGRIHIPTDEVDSGAVILPLQTVDYTTLESNFPTGTPPISETQNAAGPWLNN